MSRLIFRGLSGTLAACLALFAVTSTAAGQSGASVELVTEAGAGHQRPGPEAIARHRQWLRSVAGS